MSEQASHNTPENSNDQAEKSVDVLSLPQIEMTLADYQQHVELEPDDPQVIDLLNQYGIKAGELMIVSATDTEHPENNVLRVVATGEDLFTTNRSLTNELEARLLEANSEEEVPEAQEADEQALLDAKEAFDKKLQDLSAQYLENKNRDENALKTNAESLSSVRRRVDASVESAMTYLRQGMAQPDRISQVVGLAFEELSKANGVLNRVSETVDSSRTVAGVLNTHAEEYGSNMRRLQGEFRTDVGRIVDGVTELSQEAIGRSDTEVTEKTVQQTQVADRSLEAALGINSALRQVENDVDAAQQRTGNLLGRLEEIRVMFNRGRLDSSEYESVTRSVNVLLQELQGSKSIQRLVSLVEEL